MTLNNSFPAKFKRNKFTMRWQAGTYQIDFLHTYLLGIDKENILVNCFSINSVKTILGMADGRFS